MAIKSAFSKEKTLGFIPLYTSSKRKIALLPNTSGAIWTHSTLVVMPVRCMILGKRKAFIKCPDTVSCVTCPYKDKKQAPLISWDCLVETGYKPVGRAPVCEQAIAKDEYNSIKALMDAEDARINAHLKIYSD